MSPWEKVLEKPHAGGHLLQFYRPGERGLIQNVSQYLWEGLKSGDGAIVIATPEHWNAFSQELGRLGVDAGSVVRDKQLAYVGAQETLSRFMVDGQPEWYLFETVIRTAIRQVRPQKDEGGFRLYGEMVDLLWNNRQFAAAARLEHFWNKLLARSPFSLYCAYAIDVFGKDFHTRTLDALLCAHTHVMPSEPRMNLEEAIALAMDEVLGAEAGGLKMRIGANQRSSWAVMPKGESAILWLRKNLPDQAERIVTRARGRYRELLQLSESASTTEA